jgi:hypothetical protein
MVVVVRPFFQNGFLWDARKLLHAGDPPAGFGPTQLSKLVFGIAFTMSKFHLRDGIHGLLCPKYILLDDRFEPLILCSFVTRLQHEDRIWEARSLGYVEQFFAPETIRSEPQTCTKSGDVYSFANVLYRLFADPLQSANRVMFRDVSTWRESILAGLRFSRPANVPDPFWRLISECWHHDPESRPSFAQIVDVLNTEEGIVFPGTDAVEYQEYKERLTREVEEDPLPSELLDAVSTVVEQEIR